MLAATYQGKNERQRKKVNMTTYNISFIKRVTRKFLEVSCRRRAKQWQRNVQKKCAACANKVVFSLITTYCLFLLLFSLPSPLG